MYAKITNGSVDQYPYTIGQLRRDNPNTSFSRVIPETVLNDYGVFSVVEVSEPEYDNTKNIAEGTPVFVNGKWTQVWRVTDASSEEISDRAIRQGAEVRKQRDVLLEETDHYGLSDVTMSDAMKTYRQALRDVPQQTDFPGTINWPTKP